MGRGESCSMYLHVLRVVHVLHLPVCLINVGFVSYVLKNKNSQLLRLIIMYFWFIFLTFMFL